MQKKHLIFQIKSRKVSLYPTGDEDGSIITTFLPHRYSSSITPRSPHIPHEKNRQVFDYTFSALTDSESHLWKVIKVDNFTINNHGCQIKTISRLFY